MPLPILKQVLGHNDDLTGSCAFNTFCADAGQTFSCIGYLIHDVRCKNHVHAPASARLGASSFGYFHGANIGPITNRAARGVKGMHMRQAYQLSQMISIWDILVFEALVELSELVVAFSLA